MFNTFSNRIQLYQFLILFQMYHQEEAPQLQLQILLTVQVLLVVPALLRAVLVVQQHLLRQLEIDIMSNVTVSLLLTWVIRLILITDTVLKYLVLLWIMQPEIATVAAAVTHFHHYKLERTYNFITYNIHRFASSTIHCYKLIFF